MPVASSRRPALDGLRGLAALVVVVHHSLLVAPTLADRYAANPMPSADTWTWWVTYTPLHLVWAGREAVLVFFVLSGLVLALPAAAGKEVWWRSYYPQRLLRLYLPIFAATALAYLIVVAVPRHPHAGSSSWLRGYTSPIGLHEAVKDGIVVRGSSSLNAAFWSLQWEVYFSVLLPVFVVALVSLRRGLVVRTVVLFALIAYGNKSGDRWLFYLPIFGLGVVMAQQLSRLDAAGARFDRLKPAVRGVTYAGVACLLVARWLIAAVTGEIPCRQPGRCSPWWARACAYGYSRALGPATGSAPGGRSLGSASARSVFTSFTSQLWSPWHICCTAQRTPRSC